MPTNELGPNFLKKALQSNDLPTEFANLPNGAGLQLVEINGILLAVLKCRVQQKRNRPPHEKTPGLSSDTELCPHKYQNLLGNSRCANETNKEREKCTQSRLKTEGASASPLP
jgi:hypothetical protein